MKVLSANCVLDSIQLQREGTPAKCIHCEGPHSAYAVECSVRQREVKIMEIQQNRKITRRQAIEVAYGKKREGNPMNEISYEVYVHISINQEEVRKMCPFKMKKFLSVNCDISRECITAEKKGYIIKATLKEQYRKVMQLADIYDIPCKVSDSSPNLRTYNSTKGIVYITEYDVKMKNPFRKGFRKSALLLKSCKRSR